MDAPEDEALIREILPVLDLDHQYTPSGWRVESRPRRPDPPVRPHGRQATGLQDPNPDQRPAAARRPTDRGMVVVTSSNPDDEDRIRQRSDLLISQTLNHLLG